MNGTFFSLWLKQILNEISKVMHHVEFGFVLWHLNLNFEIWTWLNGHLKTKMEYKKNKEKVKHIYMLRPDNFLARKRGEEMLGLDSLGTSLCVIINIDLWTHNNLCGAKIDTINATIISISLRKENSTLFQSLNTSYPHIVPFKFYIISLMTATTSFSKSLLL
jgi:hypothetical protein